MKKHILLLISLLVLFISGCSKTEQDPYKGFRGYSSARIFRGGERALANKNYARAVKYFEALDALYPFGPYAEQGQLDVIYAYYMNEDSASAMIAADRFARMYPRSSHIDYAYYMRGVVGFNVGLSWMQRKAGVDPGSRDVGNLRQSYNAFAVVVSQFPHSPYAADSLVRMAYVRNLLAMREVQIAQFYMERRVYVAAANRASYAVRHFQGTPAIPQALAIMVKSYRKLGMNQMAQSSYQILQTNYPNSPEMKSVSRG